MSTDNETLTKVIQLGGDPADMPFWEGCRDDEFLLHRCNQCQQYFWPASRCTQHGAEDMQWVAGSGRGELYTYTVMHRVMVPAFKERAPYVVAVVKLDEGPFFHSNIVDCSWQDVQVGMRLRAVMQPHDNGMVIPYFTPE